MKRFHFSVSLLLAFLAFQKKHIGLQCFPGADFLLLLYLSIDKKERIWYLSRIENVFCVLCSERLQGLFFLSYACKRRSLLLSHLK